MPFIIDVNLTKFNKIPEFMEDGQRMAGEQAMMEMRDYIPMREEDLRDSQTLSKDGKTVSYHTPYARAQFFGFVGLGYRVHNYTTPGTSRRWDLRMAGNKGKMQNVKNAFLKGAQFYGSN